jgi:hypothetical protein
VVTSGDAPARTASFALAPSTWETLQLLVAGARAGDRPASCLPANVAPPDGSSVRVDLYDPKGATTLFAVSYSDAAGHALGRSLLALLAET